MSGVNNPYTQYLSGSGGSNPPTPPDFARHDPSPRSRSLPRTPGASFSSEPGYTPVRETDPAPPGVYQPLQPDVAARMTIDDFLSDPVHRYLPNLHPDRPPGTLWFDEDGKLAASIREIFERDFTEPHANFSQTPIHIVDRWFKTFAQRYHWEPSITALVRTEFEAALKKRMGDQIGRWKGKWKVVGNAAMPRWFDKTVWEGLTRYWEDPKSQRKSASCRAARLSDPDGDGPHKHCSGQTSFKARARRIQEQSGDTHPDILETLYQTKRNKAGVFVDKKAEKIYNEVTAKMQELTQDCSEESSASGGVTTAQKNQIYAEIAPRKKGKLFGTGSLGSRIERCLSPQGCSQSSEASSDLREIVDRQTQELDRTNGELAEAKRLITTQEKKISAYDRMFAILAEKDDRLADVLQDLHSEDPGSGSGGAD